jgi:hypothetical protein
MLHVRNIYIHIEQRNHRACLKGPPCGDASKHPTGDSEIGVLCIAGLECSTSACLSTGTHSSGPVSVTCSWHVRLVERTDTQQPGTGAKKESGMRLATLKMWACPGQGPMARLRCNVVSTCLPNHRTGIQRCTSICCRVVVVVKFCSPRWFEWWRIGTRLWVALPLDLPGYEACRRQKIQRYAVAFCIRRVFRRGYVVRTRLVRTPGARSRTHECWWGWQCDCRASAHYSSTITMGEADSHWSYELCTAMLTRMPSGRTASSFQYTLNNEKHM